MAKDRCFVFLKNPKESKQYVQIFQVNPDKSLNPFTHSILISDKLTESL